MIRTMFRWVVRSAVVAGAVTVVVRLFRRDQDVTDPTGSTDPAPAPEARTTPPAAAPAPAPAAGDRTATGQDHPGPTAPAAATGDETSPSAAWVAPDDGACPATHPVKAKEASGIFHVPGGLAYDRTTPDRCYRDPAAAEADGYRQAKR